MLENIPVFAAALDPTDLKILSSSSAGKSSAELSTAFLITLSCLK